MSDTVVCRTDAEYKAAVKKKAASIRIENAELASRTKLVMAIPKASWVLVAGCLVLAISAVHWGIVGFAATPVTGGASTVGGAVAFGAGATTLTAISGVVGVPTAMALVGLGLTIGGASVVKALYTDYRVVTSGPDFVLLARK